MPWRAHFACRKRHQAAGPTRTRITTESPTEPGLALDKRDDARYAVPARMSSSTPEFAVVGGAVVVVQRITSVDGVRMGATMEIITSRLPLPEKPFRGHESTALSGR